MQIHRTVRTFCACELLSQQTSNTRRPAVTGVIGPLALALWLTGPAAHADISRDCASGNWNDASCWSGGVLPTAADTVNINSFNNANTQVDIDALTGTALADNLNISATTAGTGVLLFQNGGLLDITQDLTLNGVAGSTGTLTLRGNTEVNVGGEVTIGDNGILDTGPTSFPGSLLDAGAVTADTFTVSGGQVTTQVVELSATPDPFLGSNSISATSASMSGTASLINTTSLNINGGTYSQSGGALNATTTSLTGVGSMDANLNVSGGTADLGDTGFFGNATAGANLAISNGALVTSSGEVQIARNAGQVGDATVTGAGSEWIVTDGLYIGTRSNQSLGETGGDASVTVSNGAKIDANLIEVFNDDTLTVSNATVEAGTLTLNGGTLAGDGLVTGNVFAINGGSIGPGNSPGLLSIDGGYTQDITGILQMEIGGTVAETEYDVLDISGTAFLDGILDVDLLDLGGGTFAPSLGDSFDILSAQTISGQFSLLLFDSLGSGLGWDISYLTDEFGSTDIVRLSVVSAVPVPAALWLFSSGLVALVGFARKTH